MVLYVTRAREPRSGRAPVEISMCPAISSVTRTDLVSLRILMGSRSIVLAGLLRMSPTQQRIRAGV